MKNKINVKIITEASRSIGIGHIKRCSILSKYLKKRGLTTIFLVNSRYAKSLLNNLNEFVIEKYQDADSDYIIRDLKKGSSEHIVQKEVGEGKVVLLLDDKGTARTKASIVCDPFMTPEERSNLRHGNNTKYLYGLKYSIINPNLTNNVTINASLGKEGLFICLGGSDPFNITYNIVKSLNNVGFKNSTTIILEKQNCLYSSVNDIIKKWKNSCIHGYKSNIYEDIFKSKIVITKVGMILMESFFLGTPCLTVEPTEAHFELHKRLINFYKTWPAILKGLYSSVDYTDIATTIRDLLHENEKLSRMGNIGKKLVDGQGADRIIDVMVSLK